ncbi:hypothetical protein WMY93_016569 [Mugilogobius chulae]|uniref:Uncharacterized protein n=1 Tax=Mugilogobius chulae TaxID=88201 RepID=A0AAW0NWR3_9GOBI
MRFIIVFCPVKKDLDTHQLWWKLSHSINIKEICHFHHSSSSTTTGPESCQRAGTTCPPCQDKRAVKGPPMGNTRELSKVHQWAIPESCQRSTMATTRELSKVHHGHDQRAVKGPPWPRPETCKRSTMATARELSKVHHGHDQRAVKGPPWPIPESCQRSTMAKTRELSKVHHGHDQRAVKGSGTKL